MLTRAGRRDYPRAPDPTGPDDEDVQRLHLFGEPDELIPEVDGVARHRHRGAAGGHVSVTPLSFAVELGDLSPGFQSFLGRLRDRFPVTDRFGSSAIS